MGESCRMRWRPLSRRSKRFMKLIPTYDKILDGGPLEKYTGIATMRRRCPRFNAGEERLLTW